jgi:hypothetical protein
MNPWVHESELASYIEMQRSAAGARTPVTPSFPQAQPQTEDLARLDEATAALHDLRARMTNAGELPTLISRLLVFLQELRRDFPLQAPDQAFERLQELRLWLFWLPPALLRLDESELGSLAMLSHFYGVALALDPLFPEIGGSYLGAMAVGPIEGIQGIMLARRAAQPHDTGVLTALSLMEIPLRTVSSYKTRQHFLSQNAQSYRAQTSPHSQYGVPVSQSTSSPENMPHTLYGQPSMDSPRSRGSQTLPHMTSSTRELDTRRSSGYFDAVSRPPGPACSDGNSYLYGYSRPPVGSSIGLAPEHHRISDHRMSGSGYEVATFQQAYGIDTGFVSPAELWT